MAENLVCPICGEVTSSYMGNYRKDRLCRKHALALKNGDIAIIASVENHPEQTTYVDIATGDLLNGKADKKNKGMKQKNVETEENGTCVVCGSSIKPKYFQCMDCYLETKEYMGGLDKNSTVTEFRQYYYNLKDYIFRLKDIEKIKTNCNKLIAIALTDNSSNDDSALTDRVYKDVKDLIEKKSKYVSTEEEKSDEHKYEKNTDAQVHFKYSTDGHALDSDMEIRIDDILYSSEIFHCCHKPIIEITEKPLTSDWFIPIDSINKGIYIEYNGMDTPKKKQAYAEKEELYKKYDLPFIMIERDEPKNDTQTFTAHLLRQIQQLAVKKFQGMPKWRK